MIQLVLVCARRSYRLRIALYDDAAGHRTPFSGTARQASRGAGKASPVGCFCADDDIRGDKHTASASALDAGRTRHCSGGRRTGAQYVEPDCAWQVLDSWGWPAQGSQAHHDGTIQIRAAPDVLGNDSVDGGLCAGGLECLVRTVHGVLDRWIHLPDLR